MTEQKVNQEQKQPGTQGSPKYLWHSGSLVEWEKATIHISMLG